MWYLRDDYYQPDVNLPGDCNASPLYQQDGGSPGSEPMPGSGRDRLQEGARIQVLAQALHGAGA